MKQSPTIFYAVVDVPFGGYACFFEQKSYAMKEAAEARGAGHPVTVVEYRFDYEHPMPRLRKRSPRVSPK